MRTLNLEHLLALHALVVQETGGSAGLHDLGRLEAAIAAQTQNVFGEEIHGDAVQKAAALLRGIIADHPFADGNKRTGLLAALTFLSLNGHAFRAKKGELEDFAVKVALEKLDTTHITEWLARHID